MKTEPEIDPKVREYVSSLSKNDLEVIASLYKHNANLSDITDCISKNEVMDQWLKSANGSFELFDRIDAIGDAVSKANLSSL